MTQRLFAAAAAGGKRIHASAASVLGSGDAVMDGVCFREWLSSWHKPTSHTTSSWMHLPSARGRVPL